MEERKKKLSQKILHSKEDNAMGKRKLPVAGRLNRRDFLRLSAAAATGAMVAACAPAAPQIIEVEKEVPVEKEVVKTVVVEKEVVVEKVVKKEPILIRFHGRMGTQGDHFNHFAKKFNDEHFPDIFVKCENFPGADYYKKLNTMIAGGAVGDGFWIYLGGGFRRYAATGVYAPLDPIVEETGYDLGQFYPEAVEGCRYKGKLYGLPWCLHFGCGNILYYNKPMFDDAGIDYPDENWTYDDLLAAAKELTNPDEGVFGFLTDTSTCAGMVHFPRAWGGDVTNPEGTKTLINSPESVEGLQFLSDLFHVHKVSPLPAQVYVGTYQMFAANKLAMFTSGFWGKTVGDYVDPEVWGVAPSPKGPAGRGHVFYIDMVSATANSKHPKETFMYLTYLASYEAGMDVYQVRNSIPGARPDVWEDPESVADPHFQAAAWTVKEGMPPPQHGPANFREAEYMAALQEGLELVWLGEAKLKDAIDEIAERAQSILDKPSLEAIS